ncbi:MAG: MerR family transcriptional regulator [Saprospiraceae bacterium]|nr:MerR family transcriptional regulator [Saprospiraceae bacterium]
MSKRKITVSQLSKISGVSVRTLHLYDELGLLKPCSRSEAGYRYYGELEMQRLQQVLMYRELGFPLAEIKRLLDDPSKALEMQKAAFQERQRELDTLLETIDETIHYLKTKGIMSNLEFLYKGIPKETAKTWRKEAAEKWGEDTVQKSEEHLSDLSRASIEALKQESELVGKLLFDLRFNDATEPLVQSLIARHYAVIRGFWGTSGSADLQADAYAGLGDLYVADERYLSQNGQSQPEFAAFMQRAMKYFVERSLR